MFLILKRREYEVCEIFDGIFGVCYQALKVTLGDVEVFELCHWALMNRSSGTCCDVVVRTVNY